jgi:tetratricopeptide (TPR) repeat protein
VLQGQGDLAAARSLGERALAIREKVLGLEHRNTAWSLNDLGLTIQRQGHLAEARPLYERALTIWEKELGREHMSTNRGRRDFATLLLASGNASEAFALGDAALRAHHKVLGPTHPWTKDSARITADALAALDRAEEAAALRERYNLVADAIGRAVLSHQPGAKIGPGDGAKREPLTSGHLFQLRRRADGVIRSQPLMG